MTISILISVALIWILFFWLYRDYRVDKFRQELFDLRDQLFDLALDGKIPFESASYGMLRSTINGMIQQAHTICLLDMVAFCILMPQKQISTLAERYQDRWEQKKKALGADAALAVESIRTSAHMLVVEQVVFTSAVLMFTLITAAIWIIGAKAAKGAFDSTLRRLLASSTLTRLVNRLDSAALASANHC